MTQSMISKFLRVMTVAAMATGPVLADVPNHHHHHLAQDVDAFHAVLAPVWHTRPGPERLPGACAKVDEFARLASDIRSTDASKLIASIASMKSACQNKQDNVDGAFYDVHEAFHQLLDAKPMPAKRQSNVSRTAR